MCGEYRLCVAPRCVWCGQQLDPGCASVPCHRERLHVERRNGPAACQQLLAGEAIEHFQTAMDDSVVGGVGEAEVRIAAAEDLAGDDQ